MITIRYYILLLLSSLATITAYSQTSLPFPYNKLTDLTQEQTTKIAFIHASRIASLDSAIKINKPLIIDEESKQNISFLIENDTTNLKSSLHSFYISDERSATDPILTNTQREFVNELLKNQINTISLAHFAKYKKKQEGNDLCWAACIQMLINYNGIQATQQQIIQLVLGSVDNQIASMEELNSKIFGLHPAFDDPNGNSWIVTMQSFPISGDMLVGMLTPRPYFRGESLQMLIMNSTRLPLIGIKGSHLCVVHKVTYKGIAPSRQPITITYYDPLLGEDVDIKWADAPNTITNWYYCIAQKMFFLKKT